MFWIREYNVPISHIMFVKRLRRVQRVKLSLKSSADKLSKSNHVRHAREEREVRTGRTAALSNSCSDVALNRLLAAAVYISRWWRLSFPGRSQRILPSPSQLAELKRDAARTR